MGLAMRGACGDSGSAGAAYSSPMAASSRAVAAAVMELLMLRSSLPDAITSRHRRPLRGGVNQERSKSDDTRCVSIFELQTWENSRCLLGSRSAVRDSHMMGLIRLFSQGPVGQVL